MYVGRILEKKPIAMEDFDPLAVAKVARRRLEAIREPRRRRVLLNFSGHAEAEARVPQRSPQQPSKMCFLLLDFGHAGGGGGRGLHRLM